MHPSSMNEMEKNLSIYCKEVPEGSLVGDIGAQCYEGGTWNYKKFIIPKWKYTGFDLQAGYNVDKIMPSFYDTGVSENIFDIVISGQCFEHCRNPFKLAQEIIRITKPEGWILVVAPFMWRYHPSPVDCWRFLPDGMKEMFPEDKIKCMTSYTYGNDSIFEVDCWFVGQKRK